ncbi:ATP-binding protein [Methylogaea oryzae]|uniref:ATP-binding protein n=1 Tax=Methylogaea oryzae TaxID=1295382 RepID=UPI000AFC2015|nr:ATP-binding protein [Methylogaea oryzae]
MNQEPLKLPFRPRARLLQLLGDQLIGSPRLAIFELVKNAYDADAETVTVTLKHLTTPSPTIVVEDDGEGMTLETIRDIWLVPAHDHRAVQRKESQRTRRNRLPLGEKGLGRFAVHKLGDKIQLVTRAKDSLECVVDIDWDVLIEKPFLSEADVTVRTRTPQVFIGTRTGTMLTISRLRESNWTRGEVRRLLRQITSISSPFEDRSDRFRLC